MVSREKEKLLQQFVADTRKVLAQARATVTVMTEVLDKLQETMLLVLPVPETHPPVGFTFDDLDLSVRAANALLNYANTDELGDAGWLLWMSSRGIPGFGMESFCEVSIALVKNGLDKGALAHCPFWKSAPHSWKERAEFDISSSIEEVAQ